MICGELEDPMDKDAASPLIHLAPFCQPSKSGGQPGKAPCRSRQNVRSVRLLTTLSVIHNMHTIHKASIEPIR